MIIEIKGKLFEFDERSPVDLSIPLKFQGEQPNIYDVEPATAKACKSGDLVGDTRLGGSCNFEQLELIPHCNGTHTECIGHITNRRISVRSCLADVFILAMLVSVEPESMSESDDSYSIEPDRFDPVISKASLASALSKFKDDLTGQETNSLPRALIVRTLPNDQSKMFRRYDADIPPFFTTEAMVYLKDLNVEHLLVDVPSIDRIYDEGKLSNHRIFWNIKPDSFEPENDRSLHKTITEMIYVPEFLSDGYYLLNLQIAPFESDASPSRPVVFQIKIP